MAAGRGPHNDPAADRRSSMAPDAAAQARERYCCGLCLRELLPPGEDEENPGHNQNANTRAVDRRSEAAAVGESRGSGEVGSEGENHVCEKPVYVILVLASGGRTVQGSFHEGTRVDVIVDLLV
jgi:hypothetical protein